MPICPVAPFCFVVSASLFLYLRSKKVRNPKKLENEQVTRNTFGNDFEVTISSPGKVLVAGGYLILEKPNVGISVGTTSRFYTTIKYLANKGSETSSNFLAITVDSPQFQIVYNYQFDLTTFQLNRLSKDGNEFIEGCISDTLLFIIESMGLPQFLQFSNEINRRNQSIGIKLRAHNDFYSQIKLLLKLKKPLTTKSLLDIPSFSVPEENVAKTGLGSSAALTTSLIAAILNFFNIVTLNPGLNEKDASLVHNLSQLVHCKAQGKIGSGFDVATAIYGTILYARFAQDGIEPCFKQNQQDPSSLGKLIYSIVNNKSIWNQKIIPFHLPNHLHLILGDVCGGSSSSIMAKNVISWRKNHRDVSDPLWQKLGDINVNIYEYFQDLNQYNENFEAIYSEIFQRIVQFSSKEWNELMNGNMKKDSFTQSKILIDEWDTTTNILKKLLQIRELFQEGRNTLKFIGDCSSVEIEPESQTKLLDITLSIPGVLAAGVPGAGGHDAVFVLTLSPSIREKVEKLWNSPEWYEWSNNTFVCPLTLSAASEHDFGLRSESSVRW